MRKIEVFQAATIVLLFWAGFTFGQNSVLSEGDWYKISTSEFGVHKITYDDLVEFGLDPTQINPAFIRLFGNGNGMLPESVSEFRYDDLQELSIYVEGEDDDIFDPEDFILFYGEGPTEWNFNNESGHFIHETNLYSDQVFYFLNVDTVPGKRIDDQFSTIIPYTYTSASFNDYYCHEMENENLIHSGKMWVGEKFDESVVYGFMLDFQNLRFDEPITLIAAAAGRSTETSNMYFNVNGNDEITLSFQYVNFQNPNGNYAYHRYGIDSFYVIDPPISVEIEYDKPNDSSLAWLDYFSLNFKRDMVFEGPQMMFRDINSAGPAKVTRFELESGSSDIHIWNITDPLNPLSVNYEYGPGIGGFILETDSLLEFIAFENDFFISPEFIGQIPNQNLHGTQMPDMIIVAAPEFLNQAIGLAAFRESNDNLDVLVTTPELIYNEFSSGAQDVTAIRDFAKYLFEDASSENPRFLLLLGDGSVDYKDRIENNTNFIPVWESSNSVNPVNSYCTDDFFGMIDEGYTVDIAIGRIPAKNTDEANAALQKIINYSSSLQSLGNWRNELCFIADDETSNLFFSDAEEISEIIDMADQSFNIKKIYLDAYQQETINGQPVYPDVNEAITQKINEGVLMMTYIGHGSPHALAHEKVLTEADLLNWDNPGFYPCMVNTTADFSRFDDPDIFSLGEMSFLIENKGMAAVFSATRATYAGANMALLRNFYMSFLENPNLGIGEIVRLAKNQSGSLENAAKFILFGDPSMKLVVPQNSVENETINGVDFEEFADTIHPGSQITLSGKILDNEGYVMNEFEGDLFVKVFDRLKVKSTLGNDPESIVAEFNTQDSVIVEATSEVVNGEFEISFNLPADLDENIGTIKISYYANDGLVDARGYFADIMVGGQPSSVSNSKEEKFISVYPTLTSDFLYFKLLEEATDLQLDIYSLSGEKVKQLEFDYLGRGEVGEIDVVDIPDGFYMLRITAGSKINHVKFVKK